MNSLPKTVTGQRHYCDLNPGLSVPESSTLTTLLPSHPYKSLCSFNFKLTVTSIYCLKELCQNILHLL